MTLGHCDFPKSLSCFDDPFNETKQQQQQNKNHIISFVKNFSIIRNEIMQHQISSQISEKRAYPGSRKENTRLF